MNTCVWALKALLLTLWFLITSAVMWGIAIVRWGSPDLNSLFGRMYGWGAHRITGIWLELLDGHKLEETRPCVFLGNHQSGFDLATLGATSPTQCVVVGKKEIRYIPFFGLYFAAAGNIFLDRSRGKDALATLNRAAEQIRSRKVSVYIFPEGTRNTTEEPLLPLKKGGFLMAAAAGVPLVPVVSSSLKERVNFKRRILRPGKVKIQVLDPISSEGILDREGQVDLGRLNSVMTLVTERMRSAILELNRQIKQEEDAIRKAMPHGSTLH